MRELPIFLKDVKKVGLFGLGKTNLALAKILSERADVEFIIRSDNALDKSAVPQWLKIGGIYCGSGVCRDMREDVLFLSPSVKRSREELARAEASGICITSDAEVFFDTVRSDVYAISGSDGKSTTTELTRRLLSYGYKNVYKSGNCGEAMTPFALAEELGDAHVVELSSFTLEYLTPKTKRAVITGVSENHLDWHDGFEDYIKAKEHIYRRTDGAVIWADGEITRSFLKRYPAFAVLSRKYSDNELKRLGAPLRITAEGGAILVNGEEMIKISALKRKESHNVENMMSAMALAYGAYKKEELFDVARNFGGIEHRAESLGVFRGVEYIDSSVDSTPTRTVTTLIGLARPVILILGGKGKGLSYAPLAPHASKWAKAVILNGENRGEIKDALLSSGEFHPGDGRIYEAEGLEDAILLAKRLAVSKDTVLLSPASTSYDQFKNFEERSNKFKSIISN